MTIQSPKTSCLFRSLVVALAGLSMAEALLVRPAASSSATLPRCTSAMGNIVYHSSCLSENHPCRYRMFRAPTVLRSTPEESDGETEEESPETLVDDQNDESSFLGKLNDFLDTPILDANNRSDQGAVAEFLKEFVRDEPEIAQVTFSVVVVAILAVITKVVTSF